MSQQLYHKELANGLVLLGEPMDHVSSASLTMRLPIGADFDPTGFEGATAVGAEWWLRGAGDRDTRQLNEALDSLGCHHSESAAGEFMTFFAAQLARRLEDVLAVYRDIIVSPRLADDGFGPSRDLVAQDLESLEDQPGRKARILVAERFYPYPFGRYHLGTPESLAAMTPSCVRDHLLGSSSARGSVIALAGAIDWDAFCGAVEEHLGQWADTPPATLTPGPAEGGFAHVEKDSAQTHIALAQPSVPRIDSRYYAARVAVSVLSGGMSSRLMTEVREKRGLVYHVSTSYSGEKDRAAWFTYAGTVPDKAQETLDVTVGEIRRLAEGIESAELDRAKIQAKSALVMASDSSGACSAGMANDWHNLGRVRPIDEIAQAIDGVSVDDVMAYLSDFPAREFVGVVIGPEPLDPPAEL